jgi:hypothetical protein
MIRYRGLKLEYVCRQQEREAGVDAEKVEDVYVGIA